MNNKKEFCQILISANSKSEADRVMDKLLEKRLVAGGLIIKGPSRYFWNNKIEEKEYFNVSAFSLMKNKSKIISEVEKIHSDETPIIAFIEIDGNQKFLDWIEKEVKT
jgi:uncharacterized protein involved in tolerance to divalent cations